MNHRMNIPLIVVTMVSLFLGFNISHAQTKKLYKNLNFKPVIKQSILKNELKLIKKWHLQAKPLDPKLVIRQFPVTKLDYSDGVTFQRTQDGWGGCFHYAALHIMDILNEWRAPYTPDLSFRFLEYQGRIHFNQNQDRAQQRTLIMDGVCSEARLHTNYDKAKLVGTGKDSDGDGIQDQTWDHALFQGAVPQPDAANFEEAKRYRVRMSHDYKPSVETLKTLLYKYGPVWAAGQFHYSLGLGVGEGHVVAVVGFDDSTKKFKCLNSWWAGRPADGYFDLAYGDVERIWNTKDAEGKDVDIAEIWSLRTIESFADERSVGKWAYSARIYIESSARNHLTIKAGVVGKEGLTAWEMPNRTNLTDKNGDLILDIPLPDYAAQYWPPRTGAPWFVKISDGVSGKGASAIIDVTLARRYNNTYCKSIGAFQTETYKLAQTPKIVQDNSETIVYIPGPPQALKPTPGLNKGLKLKLKNNGIQKNQGFVKKIKIVKPGFKITIASDNPSVCYGQTFTLKSRLTHSDMKPGFATGRKVFFYRAHFSQAAYLNKPVKYSFVGSAITDKNNIASFTIKSDFSSCAFVAALVDNDGKPIASSHKIIVGQVVK